MIDRMIAAYRAQIYDLSTSDWRDAFKTNKFYSVLAFGYVIFCVASLLIWYKTKSNLILLAIILVVSALFIILDRDAVKHYRRHLSGKLERLEETTIFLQTIIPDVDLHTAERVDILIKRLTEYIDTKAPFKNFLVIISNFAKTIILPITTYIAGVYSIGVRQLEVEVVAGYGIAVILLFALARLTWDGVSDIVRIVIRKDYDAAIALREDLQDIKLLHFPCANSAKIVPRPN